MINKKSYRQYLEQRMDRLTPVLDTYEQSAAICGVTNKPKKKNPLLWVIASVGGVLALALAIIIPQFVGSKGAGDNPKPLDYVINDEEPNYCTRRIFNAVVKGEENYTYVVENPQPVYFTDDSTFIPYRKLTVLDAFYVKTSFEKGMAPFFPDSCANEQIDTIVTSLQITVPSNEERSFDFYIPYIIFKYGDTIQGFGGTTIGEGSSYNHKFAGPEQLHFSSADMISADHFISEEQQGQMVYSFQITRGDDEKDLSMQGFSKPSFFDSTADKYEPIVCSLDPSSFKKGDLSSTIDLVSETAPKKITLTAKVTALDSTDRRTFGVETEDMPTLKTVFSQYFKLNGQYYSAGDVHLKVGSAIRFSYYVRFEGYNPVFLYLHLIEIL